MLPKEKKQKEEKTVALGQCTVDLLPLVKGMHVIDIAACHGGSIGCLSDCHGDQEVVSDPCRVGNILSWRFDHEIFSMVILSLPLIQEGQFLAKECAQYWLTTWRTEPAQ